MNTEIEFFLSKCEDNIERYLEILDKGCGRDHYGNDIETAQAMVLWYRSHPEATAALLEEGLALVNFEKLVTTISENWHVLGLSFTDALWFASIDGVMTVRMREAKSACIKLLYRKDELI